MAETLGELKKKRTTIKAQLTRTQNKIVNFNVETDDKGEVEARLQKIYELWDSFDITQTRIESLDETQVHERDIFEDTYFQIVAVAKRIIAPPPPPPAVANLPLGGRQVGQEQNAGDLGPTSNVKLPTISIPKFDGNYSHWLPFRDGFETLVDKNESLNNLQKFYYLKSQLQGVASQVIHSLETTADNYPQAWSLLKTRFENKRLLVRHHIQALFDIVPIAKESAMHLRKLIDDTLKHLRALKTLGQPTDQWDSLIIYMIAARLDPVTRRKWEMSITTQDTPTFEDLNVFLTQHCAVLETLNPPKQPSSKPGKSFNANKKYEESVSCISSKNEGESKSYEKKACPSCGRDHSIYHCSKFKELTTQEKWNEVKRVRVCFNCLRSDHTSDKCRSSSCRKCNKKHNTLLHIDEFYPRSNENCDEQPNLSQTNRTNEQTNVSLSSVQQNKSLAMLSTALVTIYDKFGNARVCRAVLDSGSQSNLLTKELCERLQLPKSNVSVSLTGVSLSQSHVNGSVNATIKSRSNEFKAKLPFLIIERITQNLPTAKLDVQRFKIPENITLADPSFNIPGKIDLLLGAGIFWQLLCVGQHVISRSQPILHKTKLGWVVGGNIALPETQNEDTRATLCCFTTDTSLHDQVEQFWRIEEYTPSRKFSEEERSCEDDFKANYRRDETGRFTVSLSFRSSPDQLGESREIALRRLQAINRKLDRQPELKILYEKFMNEYLALGHMSEVHDDKNQNHAHRYYIPHHAVFKESSRTSKLRVVFDASCKSASGKSLNDILRVGPTIQQELFAIVARFRQHRYVVTADIEKMYRQVNIQNDHRDLQRILWRANADAPVKEYRLNTVTYGTATAPFLAIRSLQQIAHDNEGNHPELSEIILRDFYVDDLLTGGDDIEHVKFIKDGVTELLLSGGFPLRKWTSNAPGIVDTSNDTRQGGDLPIGDEIKTLGLLWSPERDSLRYKVITRDTRSTVTKRNVLSLISQIYDPLGLVGPACIKAKIILQQLWRLKIGWDESLPSDLHTTWRQYYDQLPTINDISIPRAIVCIDPVRVELHGFCDASESAYGACIYTKSITSENETVVKLLCAKSRVAPLKSVTLPRLELCGALLLAKLAQRVTEALTLSFDAEYYWSDSQIALCWIKGEACTWKTFVSNRVAEIQELTDLRYWHHVRSEDNPADVISRGISSEQLHDCHIWWNGPQWLNQSTDDYLADTNEELYDETSSVVLNEAKRSTAILATAINEFEILERYSSMRTLTRVVAYCQRFIYNRLHPQEHKIGSLSVHELNQAMTALLKICQRQSFPQELQDLRSKRSIQKHSKLGSLHPFIDDDGLIRVGGRLQNARLLYAQKFPVVLAPHNAFTKLLIRDTHVKGLHAGLQALLSLLGENYWILSARSTVRNVLHKCLTCYRMRPKNLEQIMGNLPSVRVNPGRAFLNAGVDYGGPFNIKISRNKSAKAYLCLFVCLATRAVHLELVSDLSTTAFLNSLKRFIARRGKPSNIYSDNGSNFVGANNELKGLATLLQNAKHQSDVINFSADRVIQWHFIPPYSPHGWHLGSRLTSTEPYFVSEALYSTPEDLENSRDVTLHVMTIGQFIEDATKRDDFAAVSTALRKYLPEKDTPYILDVDLDFFSTRNPFRSLYERANLYERLASLYAFQRPDSTDPEILKEAVGARSEQLEELEAIFQHLQEHRNLRGYENTSSPRFEAVERIFRELTSVYQDSEIDWISVHDAGCTRDDTDLPHHVTSQTDLDRLITGTFRSFLTALPAPPTIVTIARSSQDDYCPPEDVDQIQAAVLEELKQRLGPEIDTKLAYLEEETF